MDNSLSIEKPLADPSNTSNLTKFTSIRGILLEFFGTAYYTYGISSSRGDPLLIALALLTPLIFLIDFSGAFFNPAIIIVKVVRPKPKMPLFLGILHIAVQIFGALFSAFLWHYLYNESGSPYVSSEMSVKWFFSGFLGETLGTFIFVMLVLIQTTEETRLTEDRVLGAFIISLAFIVGRSYSYQTGSCLNPGIALALEVFEAVRFDDAGRMKYLWIYILAPIFGGLLALGFYLKIFLPFYMENMQNIKNSMLRNSNLFHFFFDFYSSFIYKGDKINRENEGVKNDKSRTSRFKTKDDLKINDSLSRRRSKSFDRTDFEPKKIIDDSNIEIIYEEN